ncbi:hypothetical protein [Companilactobacillus mishanensis]|uniref:hypothetical protein n=1 Tax=Companilactobacillus mishanensis TaxID=2486008 RepID=UPI0012956BEC|nr:hypothetical protein [Companilactobacillus mishanensis]
MGNELNKNNNFSADDNHKRNAEEEQFLKDLKLSLSKNADVLKILEDYDKQH